MPHRRRALRRAAAVTVIAAAVAVVCAACTTTPFTTTSSESWSDPSVSSRSSRVLTVLAHGTDVGDGSCSPRVRLETTETASKVTVRAVTSSPTFAHANCAAALVGPRPFSVTLRRPLGQRAVVDTRTGTTETVLDGSMLPTVSGLPKGYVLRRLSHGVRGAITRTWSPNRMTAYPGVTLTVGPPESVVRYPASRTMTVGGRTVSYFSDGGDSTGNFSATWSPRSGEEAQLFVTAPAGRWTEATVLALVPRTERL